MPRTKSKNSDRPLTKAEAKDIESLIARGYEQLELQPERTSPEEVQKAIFAVIDAVCLGKKKATKREIETTGINLGCLWGQTICDKLGWEWCYMTAHGDEGFAIVSPDRSYAIWPASFVLTQLHKRPPEANTSLLLFNMVVGGSLDKARRRAYVTVG